MSCVRIRKNSFLLHNLQSFVFPHISSNQSRSQMISITPRNKITKINLVLFMSFNTHYSNRSHSYRCRLVEMKRIRFLTDEQLHHHGINSGTHEWWVLSSTFSLHSSYEQRGWRLNEIFNYEERLFVRIRFFLGKNVIRLVHWFSL